MTVAGTPYLMGTNTPSTAAVQTVTISTASAATDTINVFITTSGAADTISSVSDSSGNNYSAKNSNVATQGVYQYVAYGAAPLSVGEFVGVVFSGTANTKDVSVVGTAGLVSTDFNVTTHASGTSTSPSVTSPSAAAVTPDIVFAVYGYSSAATLSGTGNFSVLSSQANMTVAYQLSPSQAALTASGTLSSSVAWNMLITGHKPTVYSPPLITVFAPGFNASGGTIDGWVQAPVGFFAQTSVFRATRVAAQALNNGSNTTIAFDTILEDPTGGWVSGSSHWVAPWTGFYEITFSFTYSAVTSTYANAFILIAGLQMNFGGCASESGTEASFIWPLIGGVDNVACIAFVASAGLSTATAVGLQPSVEITYVSE